MAIITEHVDGGVADEKEPTDAPVEQPGGVVWGAGETTFIAQAARPVGDDEGRGGDILLRTGAGRPRRPDGRELPSGRFKFFIGMASEPVLQIDPSGDVFVQGRKVDSDQEVYRAFREWLAHAGITDSEGREL